MNDDTIIQESTTTHISLSYMKPVIVILFLDDDSLPFNFDHETSNTLDYHTYDNETHSIIIASNNSELADINIDNDWPHIIQQVILKGIP